MEYKRLKEKLETILTLPELPFEEDLTAVDCKQLYEILYKIEQGTMIELPCKVGDTVYVIEYKGRFVGFKVVEEYCASITFDGKKYWVNREVYDYDGFDGYVFGEYAFLTREDAEKRLLELQGETKL